MSYVIRLVSTENWHSTYRRDARNWTDSAIVFNYFLAYCFLFGHFFCSASFLIPKREPWALKFLLGFGFSYNWFRVLRLYFCRVMCFVSIYWGWWPNWSSQKRSKVRIVVSILTKYFKMKHMMVNLIIIFKYCYYLKVIFMITIISLLSELNTFNQVGKMREDDELHAYFLCWLHDISTALI